jgi:hypothetical protein
MRAAAFGQEPPRASSGGDGQSVAGKRAALGGRPEVLKISSAVRAGDGNIRASSEFDRR